MPTFALSKWLLVLAISASLCGCSRADGLTGKWQTETMRKTSPSDPKQWGEAYRTAEFSKEGKFKITMVMKGSNGKSLAVPFFSGTFTLIDTNHVKLEVIPISSRPDSKIPLTVGFWISGNELSMDGLSAGDGYLQKTKYRRVSR